MPTPVENLSIQDYKLIEYINRFQSVSKETIEKTFEGRIESIELRLSMLSQPSYANSRFNIEYSGYIIEEFIISQDLQSGTSFPISKNQFHVSPYGKKVLQDYLTKQKTEKYNIWLKSAWMPIIVSLLTNMIISLSKWLLPLIQQLLSNTP